MTKDEALRNAVVELMRHQWSNSRAAMQAMTALVDAADEAADEIERLRAALAESEQEPVAWRHIKTAPRDGTAILALSEGSDIPQAIAWCDPWANIRTGLNENNSWVRGWRMTWDGTLMQPIYWMPIPHAPSSAS